MQKPAISLVAVPGRRQATLEVAQEIERRGFSGIYVPSIAGDGLSFCVALALATKTIRFGTTIQPIYTRHVADFASAASMIHELSGGRFDFGVGLSHGPMHQRLGITAGKPLSDMRKFVEGLRSNHRAGDMPPIVLATLRKRMVRLAGEIAEGIVWANGARSHMQQSLSYLPEERRSDSAFFVGNMIPTCISDDKEAAAAVMRKTLLGYSMLPNYQNYWIEAGYGDEIAAVRKALSAGEQDKIPSIMSERWLSDVTLYGTVAEVRAGVEAWYAAGVKTPILVPSSTQGGQMQALQEVLGAFD
jgi:alkanesulfonate monooxygenase SsuD/methylene tetrahydromethanopterin reductase-like flavin-dependent oxidoreductase (luciferase family)